RPSLPQPRGTRGRRGGRAPATPAASRRARRSGSPAAGAARVRPTTTRRPVPCAPRDGTAAPRRAGRCGTPAAGRPWPRGAARARGGRKGGGVREPRTDAGGPPPAGGVFPPSLAPPAPEEPPPPARGAHHTAAGRVGERLPAEADAEQRPLLGHPLPQELVLVLEPGVVGLFADVHPPAEHEHRVEAVGRRPLLRRAPPDTPLPS